MEELLEIAGQLLSLHLEDATKTISESVLFFFATGEQTGGADRSTEVMRVYVCSIFFCWMYKIKPCTHAAS